MNNRSRRNHLGAMIFGAAILLAGALASQAHAQYGRTIEITPFAGYYIASDIWSFNTSIPLENSFTWGGRLTVNPNPRAGVEFVYTRASSEVKAPVGITYPTSKVGDLTYDSYDLNFLGYQPTGNPKVTPFASLGFGWTVVNPDVPQAAQADSRTLFNINFGLGAKVNVNERAGIRFDGRWRSTETGVQTDQYVWCDYYGYCYSYSSSWYNAWELLGGVVINLGQ